jgi:hypothetical protein
MSLAILLIVLIGVCAWVFGIRHTLTDPVRLTTAQQKRSIWVPVLCWVLFVAMLLYFWHGAVWQVSEELVVYAGLVMGRAVVACAVSCLAIGIAFGGYQAFENSKLASRIADRAVILAGFLVLAGLIFSQVVR